MEPAILITDVDATTVNVLRLRGRGIKTRRYSYEQESLVYTRTYLLLSRIYNLLLYYHVRFTLLKTRRFRLQC